ncbi:MAG: hypothetical protein J5477_07585 [Schwartzia sp.]|nr:hypothetical protein [Schwartzia sp. (in: firmicutes)]MBR5162687.1 hypothetical protein [Schwartzia sp. (in: firmicutes)]
MAKGISRRLVKKSKNGIASISNGIKERLRFSTRCVENLRKAVKKDLRRLLKVVPGTGKTTWIYEFDSAFNINIL